MINKFSFTCPIFDTKTYFEHCIQLRNKMFGGGEVEVRKGCQACIASSKCPVAQEYRESTYGRKALYPHYVAGDDPRHGKLRAAVLKTILPIKVQEQHIQKYAVPAAEQALIESANERIAEQLKSAPDFDLKPIIDRGTNTRETYQAKPRLSKTYTREEAEELENLNRAKETPKRQTNQAAATGDMSAAINA